MRILFLAPQPFFQPRGTPLAERAVLEVLSARGCEIDLLTYHEGDDVEIPNCTIHRIAQPGRVRNLRPGFSRSKLACDAVMTVECLRMVRRKRFDVLHAVEEAAFIAAMVKRLFGIPYIYDMDSSLPQQLIERFGWLRAVQPALTRAERLAVRDSLAVLAVCRSVEELALGYDVGKLVARIEDASLLAPAAESVENVAAAIGRPGPIVMYVGNLEPYQGIDLLLRGFSRTLLSVPAAQLVVIGGTERKMEHYRQRAAALAISESVHFLGPRPVSALGDYLRQADVLVSPRCQGSNTPMKIYSYMDSGRATLATRLPTHTQVLDDEVALLVEPSAHALCVGLRQLLTDPELRRTLGARARERVRREFTIEAFQRKVNAFYDRVEEQLGGVRPRPGAGAVERLAQTR